MIVQLIDKLQSYGLVVCAPLSDQEASHRSCLSVLGVPADNPQLISSCGNVIHVMHVTPHLLKNRSCLSVCLATYAVANNVQDLLCLEL